MVVFSIKSFASPALLFQDKKTKLGESKETHCIVHTRCVTDRSLNILLI